VLLAGKVDSTDTITSLHLAPVPPRVSSKDTCLSGLTWRNYQMPISLSSGASSRHSA